MGIYVYNPSRTFRYSFPRISLPMRAGETWVVLAAPQTKYHNTYTSITMQFSRQLILLLSASLATASLLQRHVEELLRRQVPAEPKGVKTIKSPGGVTIRYKEPGKHGVCETTPGVNSYSGYVDLDANTHMFFWFFESRKNPNESPITLWLNGGPGSDSMIGLFEGLFKLLIV